MVERTNAWNGRSRRNSKDYERTTASAKALLQISAIQLMLHRLAPAENSVTFNDRRTNATPVTIAA